MEDGEKSMPLAKDGKPRRSSIQFFLDVVKLLNGEPAGAAVRVLFIPYAPAIIYIAEVDVAAEIINKVFTMSTMDPRSTEFQSLLGIAVQKVRFIATIQVVILLQCLVMLVFLHLVSKMGHHVFSKESLSRILTSWKIIFLFVLYVFSIKIGYLVLLLVLPSALIFTSSVSAVTTAFTCVLAALVFLLFVYIQVIWSESQLISLEKNTSGPAATGKASETVRGRKKLVGFMTYVLLTLINYLLFAFYCHSKASLRPHGELVQLVILMLGLTFSTLLARFLLAVYVVCFYYGCSLEEDVIPSTVDAAGLP